MFYSRKKTSKLYYIFFFGFIAVFFVLLFGKNFFPNKSFFKKSAEINLKALSPAFYVKNKILNIAPYFKYKKKLDFSNRALIEENLALKSKIFELENLKKENENLNSLLGEEIKNEFIAAPIIFKPPFSDFDILIIGAGKEDGVTAGMKVVASENIILGEIYEVFENKSKVKLYSRGGNKINIILEEPMISALAIGKGGENFEINLPRGAEVTNGEKVFVPGEEHFILGEISSVEENQNSPFKKAYFRFLVNINELSKIYVIK